MKIVDTTFLIDLSKGEKEVLPVVKSTKQLYTTQINLFEFIRGLFLNNTHSTKMQEIIEILGDLRVFQLDDNAVVQSADISSTLFKKGSSIPDSDCLVAGIALANGVTTIITRDKEHFGRIEGITVETY